MSKAYEPLKTQMFQLGVWSNIYIEPSVRLSYCHPPSRHSSVISFASACSEFGSSRSDGPSQRGGDGALRIHFLDQAVDIGRSPPEASQTGAVMAAATLAGSMLTGSLDFLFRIKKAQTSHLST